MAVNITIPSLGAMFIDDRNRGVLNKLSFIVFLSLMIMKLIVFFTAHKFKILKSIILFVPIQMMDIFTGIKITTQRLFHYKPMFTNSISTRPIGMIRRKNFNITLTVNPSPPPVITSLLPLARIFSIIGDITTHATNRLTIFASDWVRTVKTNFHINNYNTFTWGVSI